MKTIILAASITVGTLFAGSPLGTVTSSENFRLSGADVSVAGVPSWPVVSGDELQTGNSTAMLRLSDGSRVVVGSNSRVSLEQNGSSTKVKLLSGSLRYSAAKDSMLEVIANQASSRAAGYTDGSAWVNGTTGSIAAASSLAGATFVPAPVFRPGPLNLPSVNQLPNSLGPPSATSPVGSLPFLSARP